MPNSSYRGQDLVDIARGLGDLAPVLPTGGFYETVALSAMNDTMTAILAGSSKGSPFNFKFNRLLVPPFYLNTYQQDYASQMTNLGWLEYCGAYQMIAAQTIPNPFCVVEVRRDLLLTGPYGEYGNVPKICWMQNDTLTFGTWGQLETVSLSGLINPGPGAVYTSPVGTTSMPINGITQVVDSFGNYWIVTGYGTCGDVNPFAGVVSSSAVISGGVLTVVAPNVYTVNEPITAQKFATLTQLNGAALVVETASPTGFTALVPSFADGSDTTGTFNIAPLYPTLTNPTQVATTVTDGSVTWTAVWPKGQGFRIAPMPAQTGPTWQLQPVAQMRIPRFTSLDQFLEPIPDDFFTYFQNGFFAQCYRRSPDSKVRAKFKDEWAIFMKSLDDAVRQGSREQDDWGFYPGTPGVMDTGFGSGSMISPAFPFGPWGQY